MADSRQESRISDIDRVAELGFDESTVEQVAKDTNKSKTEVRRLLVKGDKNIRQKASELQVKAEGVEAPRPAKFRLEQLAEKTPQTGTINVVEPAASPKLVVNEATGTIGTDRPKALSSLQSKATEQLASSSAPPKVPEEFRKYSTQPTEFTMRGGSGQNLPAVIPSRAAAAEAAEVATEGVAKGAAKEFGEEVAKDLGKAAKGLGPAGKLAVGLGLAGLGAGAAYLGSKKKEEQPARTGGGTAGEIVVNGLRAAVSPTDENNAGEKAGDSLTRSKEFASRRQEYLDLMPSGALSKKQVESINSKYEDERQSIESKLAEAKADFEAGRNRLANAELIDTLGKGLVQLMAGIYGANTGRDAVTGVDFSPKDWSSSFANLQRQYNQQYSELKDLKSEVESARKEELRQAEDVSEKEASRVGAAGRLALGEMKEEQALGREQKRAADAEAKAKREQAEAKQAAVIKLKQAIERLKTKGDKKNIQATKEAMVATGMSSDDIEQAFDVAESGFNDYSRLEQFIPAVEVPAATGATTVTIVHKPSGQSITVPANSPQAKNAQKYPDEYEIKK